MDRRLIGHYKRELEHLRRMGGEFAAEFPKIADRLSLSGGTDVCPDPYVERLLEGFAFLAARVQVKLDAEFPRFTQSMLETVYPHYLAPTPSMAVVRFEPDDALEEPYPLPRGTVLRSVLGKGEQTRCEYRTAHDVTLLPLELTEARYYTRDLSALDLPGGLSAAAGLRLRLAAGSGMSFAEMNLSELTLYLNGAGETSMRIYEQLFAQARTVVIQSPRRPIPWRVQIPATTIRQVGLASDESLLPPAARSFEGYRLLHEYFTFPERYMFFRLTGLDAGAQRCVEGAMDVIVLFDEADLDLEGRIDASNFSLGCTPAINLFPKRADPIQVTERFAEFHVVPDRTRPRDFEVYQVTGVEGRGERSGQGRVFKSFYSMSDHEVDAGAGEAYYAVNRVSRLPSQNERRYGRRNNYGGSEVFLTLVDAACAPYPCDMRQLHVETLCTNRDLPIQLPVGRSRSDFNLDVSAPVARVSCLSGPTAPRPSHAEGETAWRLISHLALNYFSLADTDRREGAAALRDVLKLYGELANAVTRKQIEGVKSVTSRPIMRRVQTPGPIAFARGLEIVVHLDEETFEGTGPFLLGAVLEQFFAKYVSLNSFTETVIETHERGKIMTWPARVGRRQNL